MPVLLGRTACRTLPGAPSSWSVPVPCSLIVQPDRVVGLPAAQACADLQAFIPKELQAGWGCRCGSTHQHAGIICACAAHRARPPALAAGGSQRPVLRLAWCGSALAKRRGKQGQKHVGRVVAGCVACAWALVGQRPEAQGRDTGGAGRVGTGRQQREGMRGGEGRSSAAALHGAAACKCSSAGAGVQGAAAALCCAMLCSAALCTVQAQLALVLGAAAAASSICVSPSAPSS